VNKVKSPTEDRTFLAEVVSMPGGIKIRECIQCGTCTGSCPNAEKMDHAPREIIALIRAGLREEVLTSNSMWYCLSCYRCTVRCPRDIKPTDLMHSLECLAVRHGLSTNRSRTPAMYKSFVDSIKSNGRVHELGFMMSFYMRTIPSYFRNLRTEPFAIFGLFGMLPLAWGLLSHGRLPLRPEKIKGKKELKAILDKAHSLGGAR